MKDPEYNFTCVTADFCCLEKINYLRNYAHYIVKRNYAARFPFHLRYDNSNYLGKFSVFHNILGQLLPQVICRFLMVKGH